MQIGMKIAPSGRARNDVDDLLEQARRATAAGFAALWAPQGFSYDALTALAVLARDPGVAGVELGVTVVTAQSRHAITTASQARTLQAASGGRAVLGIGASHAGFSERFGVPFDRPAAYVEEYLDALLPLLRDEEVRVRGERVTACTAGVSTAVAGAERPVPVLLGALGPRMLRLAGGRADGTVTFMAGPRTIGGHIAPAVTAAAHAAGRPAPRVLVGVNVSLTGEPDRVRAEVDAELSWVADLPSYRRLLDLEGAGSPGEITVAGDERAVRRGIRRLAEAGATGLNVTPVGTPAEVGRTIELLGALAGELGGPVAGGADVGGAAEG
ncbi:TIGR03564 family F420-dependent LLM class oxidoreductase [Allostreptomyces psammosilenae]|uniref:F420-dependent oxidoreductase-like protein n=1 Tax=Allostreptomyces psammosilenae TaxID=1892865 RepID=A0A853A217_9ACTN|nr:TIGR03564 family F420-dependent LLM class oxidoreductase [Allostreptomyces psammosilenae]NYI04478.1 F420-dependent oxidoreductase-like protein [Allostreptomyces psammosilenae]